MIHFINPEKDYRIHPELAVMDLLSECLSHQVTTAYQHSETAVRDAEGLLGYIKKVLGETEETKYNI